MSNIPTGLPDRITWTTGSISGPLSLYLVPAGSQDPQSAILTIADHIPNYGIYQWVPRDTIETSESAFSILMVDSTNSMTVSSTFYLEGLLSTPSNADLRRRDPVYTRSKESSSESAKSNQSVALNPAENTCGPPVTVTQTMILRGTGGASTRRGVRMVRLGRRARRDRLVWDRLRRGMRLLVRMVRMERRARRVQLVWNRLPRETRRLVQMVRMERLVRKERLGRDLGRRKRLLLPLLRV
jgi:hypothetical protein